MPNDFVQKSVGGSCVSIDTKPVQEVAQKNINQKLGVPCIAGRHACPPAAARRRARNGPSIIVLQAARTQGGPAVTSLPMTTSFHNF